MSLLSDLLKKSGVEKVEDLSPEELSTYNRYKTVLSGEKLTVETIKTFCEAQVRILEDKFADSEGTWDSNIYLKACLHVYLNVLKAIEAPEAERVAIEQHLNQIINA